MQTDMLRSFNLLFKKNRELTVTKKIQNIVRI